MVIPTSVFRPWGPIDWLLPRMKKDSWLLIGCNSVEERSLATLRYAKGLVESGRFFCIHDPDPVDTSSFDQLTNRHREELIASGLASEDIPSLPLLCELDVIKAQVDECLSRNISNVIVDISATPKRWFFALIQFLLDDPRAQTVVVTYASPDRYGPVLAENPEPIRVLPGYFETNGMTQHDVLAVGIGFEPLGLTSLFNQLRPDRIRLLFPFPPGPPGFQRNWAFVKSIDDMTKERGNKSLDRIQLHMHDCPQIFDALRSMTENATLTSALAPYGPKPMSLAMCLFALAVKDAGKTRVPVYYAQPKRYMPDYSSGIRIQHDGQMDIQAYCVKLNSEKLYRIT
jgi:hypothetical protein